MDIIHKDFFAEYFEKYLIPFAEVFGERALKHDEAIAKGKAFIKGMGKDSWTDLESRLE